MKQTLLHDHAVKDLVKKTLDPDFEKLGSGYLCGVELWFKSTLVRPDLEFFLLHIIYQYKFYPLIFDQKVGLRWTHPRSVPAGSQVRYAHSFMKKQ